MTRLTGAFLSLIALTALAAGGYAVWYVLWLGRWRARIPEVIDPIIYGGLALLLGLLCLAAIPAMKGRILRGLLALGVLAGLLASALSGTRGAWVALPVGLLVLDRYQWRWLGPRWRWGGAGAVLLILALLFAWPDTRVAERTTDAYTAIARSLTAEPGEPSGFWFRPTLYQTVTRGIIPASPWWGHGRIDLRATLQALAEQPEASDALQRLAPRREATQTHNDGLQSLVWGGVLGFVVLLAVYLIPLLTFRRLAMASDHSARRALAAMGMLVPVMYIVFGLSYSFFAFPVAVALYVVLILGLALAIRGESAAPPSS